MVLIISPELKFVNTITNAASIPTYKMDAEHPYGRPTQFFLERLESVPDATAWPYRKIISELQQFVSESDFSISRMSPVEAAVFINREWGDKHAKETIHGRLSRLATVLAVFWGDEPEVCRQRIEIALSKETDRYRSVTQTSYLSQHELQHTKEFIEWLREYRFGTRLHTLIEVIIGTHSRLSVARLIDLGDIDLERGTVRVQLSKKTLLKKYGILESRRTHLRPPANRALETYREQVRTVPGQQQQATFTSTRGRVSRSAVYREMTNKSKQFFENWPSTELNQEPAAAITPKKLWYYSLETLHD